MIIEVRLWGRTIGAAAMEPGERVASFQYDPEFARSGIEVSPLKMPLGPQVHRFPELSPETFHGLPGLLADSLPDRFGNTLIDAWLATEGRRAEDFGALERLGYTGRRGMGALEYRPVLGPRQRPGSRIELDRLVALASEALHHREAFAGSFSDAAQEKALRDILRVGTSAGGARAKAVIAWNPQTGEVRSGQVDVDAGFEHWLLKFDGVSATVDRGIHDPQGYGAIEYAYYLMATAAGITMSPCRLLEENGRRHFMTRRFDRLANGEKLHLQSLGGLAHFDFNDAGAHGYEQLFQVLDTLGLGAPAHEEQFRRLAFNIVARNQDDHVKNTAFLMDKQGRWTLAPAYDLTHSHVPGNRWLESHQMTLNGRRDGFARADFRACARVARLKRGQADALLDATIETVRRWPEFAAQAGLDEARTAAIAATHRLEFPR